MVGNEWYLQRCRNFFDVSCPLVVACVQLPLRNKGRQSGGRHWIKTLQYLQTD